MSSNFSDTVNTINYNSQDDSNSLTMSDMEQRESMTNIAYNNSFSNNMSPSKPVISVARRNERERKRVRLVNQGFAILRDRVPRDKCSRGRRSSKVETLRGAIMYIRQLQQLLLENQMRYQEQNITPCYAYVGDDLNTSVSPFCDNFDPNSGYLRDIGPALTYNHIRTNVNIQHANETSDRHLVVPWFT